MTFYQKYALLEPVPGVGTKSFQAKQISTGRDVTVHLLEGGETPQSETLLARLRNLPPPSMTKLIEVGDHEGTRYVVTAAPPYLHLDEWLAGEEHAAQPPDTAQFTRAGAWKIPAARPEPLVADAQVADAQAPAAVDEPGEFTRMFQVEGAPPSAAEDKPAQAIPNVTVPAVSCVNVALPVVPVVQEEPVIQEQSGEFTRMFQSPKASATGQMPIPAAPLPPVPAPTAPPPAAGGGEFTRLFQSPLPQAPAQDDWPAPQPKSGQPQSPQPGEFTKMFQAPAPNLKPAPEGAPQKGGEFTRFFQSPPPGTNLGPQLPSASSFPAPAPPAAPSAPPSAQGDFTGFFGRELGPEISKASPSAPPQTPARQPAGGSATQAFSIPSSAPSPPSAPQGPSEYTRMMRVQPNPGANPGAAPPMPQAGFPQLSGMQPAIPQPMMPQPMMPQPPVVQAPGNNMLLIGIFVLLAFLAGGLVVLLLVRR